MFGSKNVHNHEGTQLFTRQLDGAKVIMPRKKTPVRVDPKRPKRKRKRGKGKSIKRSS